MKTTLINHQSQIPLNLPALRQLTDKLAKRLVAADPETTWSEVSVMLTDDAGIVPANQEFFGKNRPTDVISFRCEAIPGEEGATGDLIVNVECALREGPAHEGAHYELALYIAHGIDHLSGADDQTPDERAAMRRTETAWLATLQAEIEQIIAPQ